MVTAVGNALQGCPDTAAVFLAGQYLQPPCDVTADEDGKIRINGQLARPAPVVPEADPPPPADPQTAGEVVMVGRARLNEIGELTDQTRAEFVTLLESFPATAAVEDEGTGSWSPISPATRRG